MKLRQYLIEDRYFAEIRIGDGIHTTVDGRTEKAAFDNAKRYAKKNLKGEKIKINVIDQQHKNGSWIVLSKEMKI